MKNINCQSLNSVLIDFIDKNLDKETTLAVRSHLESCKSCHAEMERTLVLLDEMKHLHDKNPPARMRENFIQNLDREKSNLPVQNNKNNKFVSRKIWLYNPFSQIAAGLAILITGVLMGYILNNKPEQNTDVAILQEQVYEMKEMLFMAKLDQPSASQRIQAVNYANELRAPDLQVLESLINTMNTDDNVNVRMASIYALSKFSNNEMIREAMVKSLKTQEDPLLQITLINVLVEIQEKKAIEVMRDLLKKEETIDAVKQMAEKGLTTFI